MKSALRSALIIACLWSSSVMANDNAGIFFYGVPPSPAQIASLAVGAKVSTVSKDKITSVLVEWPDVMVTINIDPEWNRKIQLSGIRGWLSQFPEKERTSRPVASFLAELDQTTTAYGSVISPGYEKDGKVVTLFKKLLSASGGFFFSHQSFYSANGLLIAGLSGDPAVLGPK